MLTVLPGVVPVPVQYVFMDMGTYEETRLARDDWAKYLKEGAICYLVFYNGQVSTQTCSGCPLSQLEYVKHTHVVVVGC